MSDIEFDFPDQSIAITISRETTGQVDGQKNNASPFRTSESFEAYCSQVQSRLAEFASQRSQFLHSAQDRLNRLLQAARAIEDAGLYNELLQYSEAANELLESLTAVSETGSMLPLLSPPAKPISMTAENGSLMRDRTEFTPRSLPPIQRPVAPAEIRSTAPTFATTRISRHPMRPLIDIEADSIKLRAEIDEWNSRYPLRNENGELHIANTLRLRAMACRQRRLEEEAGDTEVAEVTELKNDIQLFMDEGGDREYSVAMDYDMDPRPTSSQWAELADRHEETAIAQDAYDWWMMNKNFLTVTEVQPLAEAVAAVQQRFNRMLFRVGARDPYQQQLFDNLRTWARESQCYLFSLRPRVPMAELVEKSARLESSWEQARIPVQNAIHRDVVIDSMVSLITAPEFGSNLEQDAPRLRESLLRCHEMGVVFTDKRIREALAPWTALFESDERFRDAVASASQEWERRLAMSRSEPTSEDVQSALEGMDKQLASALEISKGKRFLILGGLCSELNRQQIELTLQMSELLWPDTHPTDKLSRFETDIQRAEVTLLSTRYSRLDWHEATALCTQEKKQCLTLEQGYGIADIVRVLAQLKKETSPAPAPKKRAPRAAALAATS